MCAINGFNFRNEELLQKMLGFTRHRGPEQQGFYFDGNVSLGHNRLSIIDLSEKGRQPLWNEDKTICLICNGEIYNFQELRKQLKNRGHQFFSDSDSEVIIHLYEQQGEKCLNELNGIFAFALYDKNKNRLFLARDPIGAKPLYYYFKGGRFIFSSEIKGILVHPIDRLLNQEAFFYYFRLRYTPAPLTLLKDIYKLPAGRFLIYENSRLMLKKYWDIEQGEKIKSKREAKEKIRTLFVQAVERQLIADRPLGIFLSGGVDSTAVLGSASQFISGRVKTYSVGFDTRHSPEKYNLDFELARQTAKHYQTFHHELLISGRDAADNLEKIIYYLEEPIPNATMVPLYFLAKEAKKTVDVVLSGDGGDELFAGYPRYYYNKLLNHYQLLPGLLRKGLLSHWLGEKYNTPKGLKRYLLFMAEKDKSLAPILKNRGESSLEDFLKKQYPENKFKDDLKYLMYLDFKIWLCDESLLRSDKLTMASALENRVPVLDKDLVGLAFQIPPRFQVRGRKKNKWLYQEAMADYLPEHIKNRKKRGFFSPGAKWLREELKDLAFEVLSPNYLPETRELFDFNEINRILQEHLTGRAYHSNTLWSLLCFQLWYKQFINEVHPR